MSRIALTGTTGFIGRSLVRGLLARGHEVRALVRQNRPDGLVEDDRLTLVTGDLHSPPALQQLVADSDAVIHLAGAIRGRSREDFQRINTDGTRALAQAVAHTAADAHFVHVSSLAASKPELSWYAGSKREGEDLLPGIVRHWSVLRPPAVYGPEDPALAPVWRALARGWLPVIGSPHNRFSLVYVDDVVEALCRLAAMPRSSQRIATIHDGRSNGYDWRALAELAAAERGGKVRTITVPPTLLRAIAAVNLRLSRFYHQPPVLVPGKARELAHHDWVCNNDALGEILGWTPGIEVPQVLQTLPGWGPH